MNQELFLITEIIKNKSLNKAAKALGISQPALSVRISRLEEKIGATIFDREKTPIELTKEGKLYVVYLKKCKILHRDFEYSLSAIRKEGVRQITVGGPAVYLDSLVTDALPHFHEACPDCHIHVVSGSQQELVRMANDSRLDFFICASDDLPKEFVCEEVRKEKLFLCMPRDLSCADSLEGTENPDYSNLDGQSFIFMESEQPLQRVIEAFLDDYHIKYQNYIRVNQVSTALRLAESTKSVFVASGEAISNGDFHHKLAVYQLAEKYMGRSIYVAHNRYHEISECEQVLIDILKG